MYKNFKSVFKVDYLESLCWGAAKAYRISTHEICMETLEHDEKNAKIWLEKQPKRTWARAYFDLTSKCDAVTSNFSESFNAWILKIRDKPLFQFVDKYTLTVMTLMHDRRELGLELTDGDLVPAVTDIKPTNVVLPPPNNRNPGRPRKQRIRGRDKEKSSGKRKCRRCGRGVGGSSTHAGKESDDSIVDLTGEVYDNSTEAQTEEGSNSLTQAQTREGDMVNGKENGGEMKAKVGGNTRWTMTSFAGETLQR
ncbi:hypothetical protein IFM89_021895 [Coptis chinensis]|uniref:Uncharacterized protein n=1 Tax=Coptis chinensis TaxID=261450 RepID=A0A835HER8_9MAGN|nr:hypothetical protein IFM89_021895 [Coptis chinensis]